MQKKFTYGMVGGGPDAFIGAVHRAAIRLNDQAEIVAGCFSRSEQKRSRTARELGIDPARNYPTYEQMAEAEGRRADKIDWVTLVTPNKFHYPAAKLFLEQGINVVCDKPLCFSVEEGEELKRIAWKNGCLFCVTYAYTGFAMARQARAMVRKGIIGDIRMVMAEYPQDWLLDSLETIDPNNKPWRADPELSGRGACIADIGTHVENWVRYVTGLEIDRLCCNLDIFAGGGELDNNAEVMLKYKGGATGMYWASQVAIGFDNALKIRIFGNKGTIEFLEEDNNYLRVSMRGKPPQIYSRGCAYLEPEAKEYVRTPSGHPEGLIEAFANLYKDFCAALRDKYAGKKVDEATYGYPTIDMGIAGVRFAQRCIESSDAGSAWVEFM